MPTFDAQMSSQVTASEHTHEDGSDAESYVSTESATDLINGQPRFFGCYLLVSMSTDVKSRNRTYVGFTVAPCRRLRQHNGELARGGALRTSRHRPWRMVAIVHGFACKVQALAFEWAWTNPTRTRTLASQRGTLKFPTSPRGRLRALAALCGSRPWRHCPLTLSVLMDAPVWRDTLGAGRKDEVVLPPTLRIAYQRMEELSDVGAYTYREAADVDMAPAEASCMVCSKSVGATAKQARTQCGHCGAMACLSCMAMCVTEADQDGAEDRLVPDVVFCARCQGTMPWVTAARLSRALAAEASAAYDISVTQAT